MTGWHYWHSIDYYCEALCVAHQLLMATNYIPMIWNIFRLLLLLLTVWGAHTIQHINNVKCTMQRRAIGNKSKHNPINDYILLFCIINGLFSSCQPLLNHCLIQLQSRSIYNFNASTNLKIHIWIWIFHFATQDKIAFINAHIDSEWFPAIIIIVVWFVNKILLTW